LLGKFQYQLATRSTALPGNFALIHEIAKLSTSASVPVAKMGYGVATYQLTYPPGEWGRGEKVDMN
jgi:hypothetical protein